MSKNPWHEPHPLGKAKYLLHPSNGLNIHAVGFAWRTPSFRLRISVLYSIVGYIADINRHRHRLIYSLLYIYIISVSRETESLGTFKKIQKGSNPLFVCDSLIRGLRTTGFELGYEEDGFLATEQLIRNG
jgi:hypothetical protein